MTLSPFRHRLALAALVPLTLPPEWIETGGYMFSGLTLLTALVSRHALSTLQRRPNVPSDHLLGLSALALSIGLFVSELPAVGTGFFFVCLGLILASPADVQATSAKVLQQFLLLFVLPSAATLLLVQYPEATFQLSRITAPHSSLAIASGVWVGYQASLTKTPELGNRIIGIITLLIMLASISVANSLEFGKSPISEYLDIISAYILLSLAANTPLESLKSYFGAGALLAPTWFGIVSSTAIWGVLLPLMLTLQFLRSLSTSRIVPLYTVVLIGIALFTLESLQGLAPVYVLTAIILSVASWSYGIQNIRRTGIAYA